MRKVIPKIPKQKGLFKNLPWFDMAYLAIVGALCLLVFMSNLGVAKYIVIVAIVVLAAISEIRVDGISMAHNMYLRLKAATKPNLYIRTVKTDENADNVTSAEKAGGSVEQLHNIDRIEDGIIYFGTGVVARLIEIPDISFILKDESVQDRYEDIFGKCFNIIEPYKNVTFIKTEREIDYTPHIKNLSKRISTIKASTLLSQTEKSSRTKVIKSKIAQYKALQCNTYIPVYHLVIRAGSIEELEELSSQIVDDLSSADIPANFATNDNIGVALSAQYFKHFSHGENTDIIRAKDILPEKIKVGAKSVEVDGQKITTYSISSLPGNVTNAWIAGLCNVPNVNVTINVMHANAHRLVRRIDRVYFETGLEAEQTARLSENVVKNSQQSSMENLVEDVEYSQDKLCEIEILVTFVNEDKAIEKEVNKHVMDLKMKRNHNKHLQLDNFVNSLVGGYNKPLKRNKHIFTTKLLGMAFPMIFPNILEEKGDLIGFNECGVPVSIDWHARDGKLRVNSNMFICGKSGGGKSFFLKMLLLNRAASGDACFVIDVESEYTPIAEYFNGIVIDMSKGEFRINPLHAFSISSDGKNSVSDHILVVEEFFRILYPDISMEHCMLIKELLAGLYQKFGISDDIDVRSIAVDKFPIMSDLYDYLNESLQSEKDIYIKQEMLKLRLLIRSMLSGANAKYWNGASALNINNSFVVFNVQTLLASGNLNVVNAQMKLLSRYINTQLIENFKHISSGGSYRRIWVLIDEVHRMLSLGMSVTIALCVWLAKQCRKYEGGLITASQSVADLVANEALKSQTKAVLTESQVNGLFGAKSTHIPDIVEIYSHTNLSQLEVDSLKDAPRGRALFMVSDVLRMNSTVTANKLENELCARKIDQTERD